MESRDRNSADPTAEDSGAAARRIERLSLHLNPLPGGFDGAEAEMAMVLAPCAARAKMEVDTEQLSKYMRGKYRDEQQGVYDYFNSRPELQTPIEILKEDHRELCMRQLMGLVREAGIKPFRYVVDDPGKYFAILEAVGSVDMSLGIKMGVQFR